VVNNPGEGGHYPCFRQRVAPTPGEIFSPPYDPAPDFAGDDVDGQHHQDGEDEHGGGNVTPAYEKTRK